MIKFIICKQYLQVLITIYLTKTLLYIILEKQCNTDDSPPENCTPGQSTTTKNVNYVGDQFGDSEDRVPLEMLQRLGKHDYCLGKQANVYVACFGIK